MQAMRTAGYFKHLFHTKSFNSEWVVQMIEQQQIDPERWRKQIAVEEQFIGDFIYDNSFCLINNFENIQLKKQRGKIS